MSNNFQSQIPIPTEAQEQEALFRWAAFAVGKYPEIKFLYHIPNEGKRSVYNGAAMRRQGLKKGVPDLCLPVPSGKYHALYIEMKRKGEKPSLQQLNWLDNLNLLGNRAVWCQGWEAAAKEIERYLRGE